MVFWRLFEENVTSPFSTYQTFVNLSWILSKWDPEQDSQSPSLSEAYVRGGEFSTQRSYFQLSIFCKPLCRLINYSRLLVFTSHSSRFSAIWGSDLQKFVLVGPWVHNEEGKCTTDLLPDKSRGRAVLKINDYFFKLTLSFSQTE